MDKNKKWFAVLAAVMMAFACMGCRAEIPSYLIVDGTTLVGYTKELPANLVIPEGITKIAESAFRECKSLESVTIPTSVTEIDSGAFWGCGSIRVEYEGTLLQWCEMDNDSNLGENAKGIKLKDRPDLKAVTALDLTGAKRIGSGAFSYCKSLESVVIPASVKKIDTGTFYECKSLKIVEYEGTLLQWCEMDNDSNLGKNAKSIKLKDGTDLKTITTLALKGAKRIGSGAFSYCKSLESVVIPASVKKIGNGAFYECVSLASVTIPSSVKEIDDWTFFGCDSLESVVISTGVRKIGWHVFYMCKSLRNVMIPASVTEIGVDAFYGCGSINVEYDGTFLQWCEMDNEVWLEKNAKSIKMKDGTDLKLVTMLDLTGAKRIGNNAFWKCESLESVVIPASVKKIGDGAFGECVSLTSVTIPNSVKEIGWHAFDGCSSLASVTIPASVTKIGDYAFSGCISLESVTYTGTKAQWEAIEGDKPYATVHCTDGDITVR